MTYEKAFEIAERFSAHLYDERNPDTYIDKVIDLAKKIYYSQPQEPMLKASSLGMSSCMDQEAVK